MTSLKVVLLSDSNSLNGDVSPQYKGCREKLWATINTTIKKLNYSCEIVDLHKLDFQEYESVNKFFNADIVVMVREKFFLAIKYYFFLLKDVTNQACRPIFMYHKGHRESVDFMNDIVLIQASSVNNDNTMQYLKVNIN